MSTGSRACSARCWPRRCLPISCRWRARGNRTCWSPSRPSSLGRWWRRCWAFPTCATGSVRSNRPPRWRTLASGWPTSGWNRGWSPSRTGAVTSICTSTSIRRACSRKPPPTSDRYRTKARATRPHRAKNTCPSGSPLMPGPHWSTSRSGPSSATIRRWSRSSKRCARCRCACNGGTSGRSGRLG